ncbi:glycosyltransferase [Paucibacter soli]|uniref:glycosyltransferase n=1 Tax=Paucibacter soli TaxID=3133433 RepID=UPI0030B2CCEA
MTLPFPHVLLATSGTGGDLLPFVRLGQLLQARGHSVSLFAPSLHEASLRASGLPYKLFGAAEEDQALLDNPQLWHEREGFGVILRSLMPRLLALRQHVLELPGARPCALVCHPILLPGADLARAARADVRVIGLELAPSNLRTVHDPLMVGAQAIPGWLPIWARRAMWGLLDRIWVDPHILPALNAERARLGLPAVAHFLAHMQASCDAALTLFPDWFAPALADWPGNLVHGDFLLGSHSEGAVLAPALQQFLAAGDAPIAFTPGTGNRHAAAFFAAALQALQRLGRRGLFISTHAEQIPQPLPSEVMCLPQAPFEALLPRLAAVVHHGGIGTMAEALRAGTPQLVVPSGFDQFDNGARAHRLGVAEVLPATRVNARRLQGQLSRLLDAPDRAERCRSAAARFAPGAGNAVAAERLEALLART